jgi:hypothetical protein
MFIMEKIREIDKLIRAVIEIIFKYLFESESATFLNLNLISFNYSLTNTKLKRETNKASSSESC